MRRRTFTPLLLVGAAAAALLAPRLLPDRDTGGPQPCALTAPDAIPADAVIPEVVGVIEPVRTVEPVADVEPDAPEPLDDGFWIDAVDCGLG